MVNILTTDGERLFEACSTLCLLIAAPLLLLMVGGYSIYLLGTTTLLGFLLFASLLAVQVHTATTR